jgi:branched-chain amino acid transport system substrate-binding protein
VIDAGKSQAQPGEFGGTLYDHGVYNSMLIAEAIATAQKITGKKVVTGEDVRRGLENINLDEARLKAIGLAGFASPLKITCADHNSHGATFVQEWDGAKWVKASAAIPSATEKVLPLLDAAAKGYAEKNAGWPTRTEACDNKS